ncbi:MAG: hypothetical protein QJR05_10270 [Thermoanaerobacterium sp.]|nr:hypothetical protein [Thermoanaerobacterium sp.]
MRKIAILVILLSVILASCGKAKPVENNVKTANEIKSKAKNFNNEIKDDYKKLYEGLPDVSLPQYDFTYSNADDNAYKKIVFANYDKLLIYDGKALVLFRNKKFYMVLDAEKFNLKYFQGNKSTKFIFSPYGSFVVAGNSLSDDAIYLINVNTGRLCQIYSGDIDKVNISWSPLEKYLVLVDEEVPSKAYIVDLKDFEKSIKYFPFDINNACIDDMGKVFYDGNGVFKDDSKISSGNLIYIDYDNLYTYDDKTFTLRDVLTGKSLNNYDVGFNIRSVMYKDDNILFKDANENKSIIYNISEKKFYKVNGNVVNISKDIFGKKSYYFVKKYGSGDIFIVDEKTGKSKKTLYAFSPIVDINTYLGFSIGNEVDLSTVKIGVNDNNLSYTVDLIN